MCGTYYLEVDDEMYQDIRRIIREVEQKNLNRPYKTGKIYPKYAAPVIVGQNNQVDYSVMDWGFPKWDSKGVIFNARSETALTKKMFSASLLSRRCLVPATGFFESQKIDPTKPRETYLFTSDETDVMYMAGIYNQFQDKEKFTILTREANDSVREIHNRMPVIVRKNEIEDWLFDNRFMYYLFSRDDIRLNMRLA